MTKQAATPGGKQRYLCRPGGGDRTYCYSTTDPKATEVRDPAGRKRSRTVPIFTRTLGGVTTLLVTAAQNATPVHKGFLAAAEALCNERHGELLAVPVRYKNPTSHWTESQANEEIWAPELVPYLCNERKRLNKNLILLGDVKTQPTAVQPLAGYEALTQGESGILAHTKLALRTIPTPQNKYPKIMSTTGAMTLPNYTDSKAGKLGEFHHTLGACLVELKGKRFHMRQINYDLKTESFIDLTTRYDGKTGMFGPAEAALALVMGDTHRDAIDPQVEAATFSPDGGIVSVFKPRALVWHDLNDDYSVNPHHAGNVFVAIAKRRSGRADVRAELARAVNFVIAHTPGGTESFVVPSNHNDFLTRWILNTNPHTAPGNFEFWCETALAMARGTTIDAGGTKTPEPFAYWGRKIVGELPIKFLSRDESLSIGGVELGMHGDQGPNGSRGSIKNLRRIGVKSIIGHTHSPGIDEGCYQVGTSTARKLEYTSGPSGWLNTHAVVYANGKRSLINIIDGEWRLG